ncbi:hypothetical protein J2X69_000411 [Algoriphagus sp. 4150]|uniref:hypothetical protein n=1 Tax=Algoriphagus sp. 4150 TaxID=2817756 RepID=UPI00286397C5|nr:hypothetical protein [Algoriphagus sp. 4150]MDR7128083.1 hypothetical protein [Algoriphagus sp. 4150]
MEKIREVRVSFERLLKVWLSKLDNTEEDLIAEDMIWFSEIFDDFFKGSNLNEYINRDGRYENRLEDLDKMDFTDFLNSTIEFSNSKEDRWARLIVEKPNQFDYYRQLNELNSENYKNYNVIDIYFRILKKLYSTASEYELKRTKNIVLSRVTSTVHKVSVFEKEGFKSIGLLSDFYYEVLKGLFSKKEIESGYPDEEFIGGVLFLSVFYVYYLPLLSYQKVSLIRRYLLNIWIYLSSIDADNLIDEFLNSLSNMTTSNLSFKEIDLYDIRSLLKNEDRESEFYKHLDSVKKKGSQIILLSDLEEYKKLLEIVSNIEVPGYLPKNIVEYFLKTEEDTAIQLYKFRNMQSLVLEYLSLVLHFKDVTYFRKAIIRLRKNEQWSNHRKFLPKSMYDVLVWIIIFSDLKREMNFRIIEPSFGYKYLGDILVFLFKDIEFDEVAMKRLLDLKGLQLDSSFLNSMAGISDEILKGIGESVSINDSEKKKNYIFWDLLVNWFQAQIQKSETLTPLPHKVFKDLISGIENRYKQKSVLYFLSKNLSPFDRKDIVQKELKTLVIASDLQLRKYLIPDWYSPAYGLSESISGYLFEEEIMQFDYNFFHAQIPINAQILKRESFSQLTQKYGRNYLFVFRNAYPDFWIKSESSKSDKNDLTLPLTFSYNTYDRNSELIIVPKSSMSVRYVNDGRFKNLQFLDNTLMWELLDLGESNEENLKKVKSIKGFPDRYSLVDEELRKHFWIRIVAKTKVIIKDENSILRFKLNPYGD